MINTRAVSSRPGETFIHIHETNDSHERCKISISIGSAHCPLLIFLIEII